jgi:beta-phosphoglucomutase-like phosphatase (HAD superfamily)
MKKLSGILFDFNGTLFFDSFIHIEAFKKVFVKFGKDAPTDEYIAENLFGRTNEMIYKQNFNENANFEECERFRIAKENYYYDICLSSPEKMKLTTGACNLLDYVKNANIPYCIATGSGLEEVEFFIKHLGLDRWFSFDNIVYTNGTFRSKPYPDCYLLAAKRLSLSPSECLVFEDGTSGIKAARAANAGGVVAIYEKGLPSPIMDDAKADQIHHDLSDWNKILKDFGLMR